MAEERLIDDDKDRRYKIRKNADGEDELYIDTEPDEEEETEQAIFEVTESDSDDEEAAVLTPEQLAERERARIEAEEKRAADLEAHIIRAQKLADEGKFEDALYVLDEAAALERGNGRVCALKLVALTCGFRDFSRTYEIAEAAETVKSLADESVKAELKAMAGDLDSEIAAAREKAEKLEAGNEAAKSARREKYAAKYVKSAIWFGATAAPLLVLAALTAFFGSVMHSQLNNTFMTLFYVFLGLTAAAFVLTVITARNFWASANLRKRNEKNSSTKLGRETDAATAELKLLTKISEAIR